MDDRSRAKMFKTNGVCSTSNEASAPQFDELDNLVDWLSRTKSPRKDIPIVLVPGFAGWGAPLLNSFNYFGGFDDLTGRITAMGWNVILPSIGPLSSNWERACELYSQLTKSINTAGAVDYGAAFTLEGGPNPYRSRCSKYARKPAYKKPKPGPNVWVMPDDWEWNEENPVHFICHSQGGNTVRYLVDLMRRGNQIESYFVEPGRDSWIRSVTTLATPHNGSTVIDILNESGDNVERLLSEFLCATSFMPPATRVYDLQLDHWGIHKDGDEDFSTMLKRMTAPQGPYTLWRNSNLNGFYDNSIEGSAALNVKIAEPSPRVCYFTMSFSCSTNTTTFKIMTKDIQTLIPAVLPPLKYIPLLNVFTYPLSWFIARVGNRMGTFSSLLDWGVQRINARIPKEAIIPAVWTSGSQLPRWDILPIFAPTAYAMGGYTLTAKQSRLLGALGKSSKEWQTNDGVVNTISQQGPWGKKNVIVEMSVPHYPEKGVFNHLGTHKGIDHADVLGINVNPNMVNPVEGLYESLAQLLSYID